jgi:hypothetical protein
MLPRQARDKHRENSKKGRFLAGSSIAGGKGGGFHCDAKSGRGCDVGAENVFYGAMFIPGPPENDHFDKTGLGQT